MTPSAAQPGDTSATWLGRAPTRVESAATLYAGVVALMIGGVQPLVFGALVDAQRIGLADLGRLATLEALGMAAGSSAAALLLGRTGARPLGLGAALAVAAGNFAMPLASSVAALFALRGAIGVAEGALLALPIAMIARAPAPERWAGAFLGVQTLAQGGGAWLVPALLTPRLGANGGFFLLGALAALACITSSFGSQEGAALASQSSKPSGRVPAVAWLGLAWIFVSLASTSAVWSYFERIGAARGYAAAFIGAIAAGSLVAQAAGSFSSILLSTRLGWIGAVASSAVVQLVAIAAFALAPGAGSFAAAACAFGFFWLFAMPYQVRALVELDPSRRSARLIASAQILGSAAGPWAGSWFVHGGAVSGVLRFSAGATLAGLALAGTAAVWSRRRLMNRDAGVRATP